MVVAVRQMTDEKAPPLKPYACTEWNARLKKWCDAIVIDGYAPAGAVIRRKCGVCGNWNIVRVESDPAYQVVPRSESNVVP